MDSARESNDVADDESAMVDVVSSKASRSFLYVATEICSLYLAGWEPGFSSWSAFSCPMMRFALATAKVRSEARMSATQSAAGSLF